MLNEHQRLQAVQNIKIVDKALLGDAGDKLKTVETIKPDIIFLGYDQKVDEADLAKNLKNRGLTPKIIRAKPYKETLYKSSIIKSRQYPSGSPK